MREIAAKNLYGLYRGGIGPQWHEMFGDVVDARSIISRYIKEIVGVFVLTA
jgi:hypothetical protein